MIPRYREVNVALKGRVGRSATVFRSGEVAGTRRRFIRAGKENDFDRFNTPFDHVADGDVSTEVEQAECVVCFVGDPVGLLGFEFAPVVADIVGAAERACAEASVSIILDEVLKCVLCDV